MKVNPVLFAKAIADETRQKIMSEFQGLGITGYSLGRDNPLRFHTL